MRKIVIGGMVAAFALAGAGHAQAQDRASDRAGTFQAKLFATAVLPDGKIKDVNVDLVGLPADTQTEANDNVVPTVAIEYFLTNNISIETICCITQHDVDTTEGALTGAELVSDAKVVPATVTVKAHADLGVIKPYVGAGPTLFLWIDEKAGAAAVDLGVDKFKMSNELGFALQAGFDVPIGDSGFGVSVDAKRYFVNTTASWYVDGTKVIETEHKVDPWVVSAGVTFAF